MRTLLILAAGVWLGRRIEAILAENRARERETQFRRRLEALLREELPAMQETDRQRHLKEILK